MKLGNRDVLVVVDLQNDFCPGGALPVPNGDEVVPVINQLTKRFSNLVLTQDWHPADHASFASMHPGKRPYDSIPLAYGPQTLWPDHCVQGTAGADLRADLDRTRAQVIIRKGYHRDIDSYSAFFENDRLTPTGLAGYLRERGLERVFLAGLALDFCVRWSAEDAYRLGFKPIVVADACRGIGVGDSVSDAHRSLGELGVVLVNVDDVA
jgi:nicotinamidase/pyrazinamidase